MKITVCKTEMDFPGEVGELRDSNDLLENMDAIHARIGEDGYLLLRNFIDREDVLVAKEKFRTEIESANADSIQINKDYLAYEEEFKKILESPRLFEFFKRFFGESALTFDKFTSVILNLFLSNLTPSSLLTLTKLNILFLRFV